jgi:diguanylate cyclase
MTPPLSEAIRFVRRVYGLRLLGLGTGALCVGGALAEHGAAMPLWVLLALNGYLWPHVAFLIASRARDPARVEFVNLVADSALGGFWIAAMGFSPLPSALLATMLSIDKIVVGGWRFASRTALALAGGCAFGVAVLGLRIQPSTDLPLVLASLPFLIAYPVAIATVTHALARTVRRQNRLLDELNRIDALTGLPNRRHWQDAGAVELRRYHRNGRPAALVMIDIDAFKQINDTWGHSAGDAAICRVADAIRDCLGELDTPGRFGGDELGVVLAETLADEAVEIAERIRARVEAGNGSGHGPPLTISVGVAPAEDATGDMRAWIDAADAALYRAKRLGRDRVAVAQ